MSNDARLDAIPAGEARAATAGGGRPPAQVIEAWLVEKVAELVGVDAGEIDPEKELTAYGLSSVTGVMLAGDIEDWLGVRLEPTVAWEYPTVRELARFLAGEGAEEVGA
jgi:8-amino-7-oxononanoate synthase